MLLLRNNLGNFKQRLKALEVKVAEDGVILTESQVQALERKKLDDWPVARLIRPIQAISALRTPQ